MRGYFGIGVEGLSKPYNAGALMRTAHAFGAAFLFTVRETFAVTEGRKVDTSGALAHVPFYSFPAIETMVLPRGCALIGIELADDAIDLPSFRHPLNAAYVLGPERGSLSAAMIERCEHVVRIPTRFCVNVATAGTIVMYDRMLALGRFTDRAVAAGPPTAGARTHVHGNPRFRHLEQR